MPAQQTRRRTATSSSLALEALAPLSLADVHSQSDPSSQPNDAKNALSLQGCASGLYPGADTPLTVSDFDLHRSRIRVTRFRADALHPDRAMETLFQVSPLRRPFTASRLGHSRTQLSTTMLPQAPDACRGVRLPMTLRATAERRS